MKERNERKIGRKDKRKREGRKGRVTNRPRLTEEEKRKKGSVECNIEGRKGSKGSKGRKDEQ